MRLPAALVRRYYGARYGLAGQDAKAHRCVRIAAVAVLALWIAWGVILAMMMADFSLLSPDVSY
jgi:cytochrome b